MLASVGAICRYPLKTPRAKKEKGKWGGKQGAQSKSPEPEPEPEALPAATSEPTTAASASDQVAYDLTPLPEREKRTVDFRNKVRAAPSLPRCHVDHDLLRRIISAP